MTQAEQWILTEKYQGIPSDAFRIDCARLAAGEPIAYIIGWVDFLGARIWLDSKPLIPRPETEFLVERTIANIEHRTTETIDVLDMCAGSGCIGVAVLTHIATARVDFAEIDVQHHSTIAKNIVSNGITPERTRIFGGNLFAQITGTYDVIVSNPPYIDASLNRVDPDVQQHEPAIALYGGTDGLEYITHILASVRNHLKPSGILVLEHEPEQVSMIRACAEEKGLMMEAHTDQFGIVRYSTFTCPS